MTDILILTEGAFDENLGRPARVLVKPHTIDYMQECVHEVFIDADTLGPVVGTHLYMSLGGGTAVEFVRESPLTILEMLGQIAKSHEENPEAQQFVTWDGCKADGSDLHEFMAVRTDFGKRPIKDRHFNPDHASMSEAQMGYPPQPGADTAEGMTPDAPTHVTARHYADECNDPSCEGPHI